MADRRTEHFWLIVVLPLGARYIDIVRFKGTTIHGDPATKAHFP